MERFFFCMAVLYQCVDASAQEPPWEWVIGAGGTSYDNAYATAADTSGNFYVGGSFRSDSITFDTITIVNPSDYGSTAYVVKLNSEGHALWMRIWEAEEGSSVSGMTFDAAGGLYVCGAWESTTMDLCGTTFINAGNDRDGILVKYDTDGNCLWARQCGGEDLDAMTQVATDTDGHVYVIGSYDHAEMTIGDTVLPQAYQYSRDIFLAKYLGDGTFQWARRMGGSSEDIGYDVACDTLGRVHIAGTYRSPQFFIGNDTLYNTGAFWDGFLATYDGDGNELWVKRVASMDADQLYELAVDPDGHAYIVGSYYGDELSLDPLTLENSGTLDGYIAKFDPDGHALWAVPVEGPDFEEGLTVVPDGWGGCLVTGIYRSPVSTLGGFDLLNPDPDQSDFFVAWLDENGNVMWRKTAHGNNYDLPLSMTMSRTSGVLIAGHFEGDSLMIGTQLLTNTTPPIPDIFVATLKDLDDLGLEDPTMPVPQLAHFPDPASDHLIVRGVDAPVLSVEAMDLGGRRIPLAYERNALGIRADVSALPAAVYVLCARTSRGLCAVRFSVQR